MTEFELMERGVPFSVAHANSDEAKRRSKELGLEENEMTIPINLHKEKAPFRALGRCVLLRIVKRSMIRGVGVSENSAEANRYFALSVGPKVENIKEGDELILGGFQVPFLEVPGCKDLIVVTDANCYLVKTGEEGE